MSAADAFLDTNVILYLLAADAAKAERAEALVGAGGHVSVQVLNEIVAVTRRKFGMPWREVANFTAGIRSICRVSPLTVAIHERGLELARRHGYSICAGTIVASALAAGCSTLYSEDLQDGQLIDRRLTVRNPF